MGHYQRSLVLLDDQQQLAEFAQQNPEPEPEELYTDILVEA